MLHLTIYFRNNLHQIEPPTEWDHVGKQCIHWPIQAIHWLESNTWESYLHAFSSQSYRFLQLKGNFRNLLYISPSKLGPVCQLWNRRSDLWPAFLLSEIAYHRIENRVMVCTKDTILGNMFPVLNIHCVYCVTRQNVLLRMSA